VDVTMSRGWLAVAGLVVGAVALVSWHARRPHVSPPAPAPSETPPLVVTVQPDAALVVPAPPPRGPVSKKTLVEVAYLRHFIRGIVWPPGALGAPGSKLELCILGDTELGPALEGTERDPAWQEYPVRVRRVPAGAAVAALASCHLLVLPDEASFDAIPAIRDRPTLTISDRAGASERGVHLAFFLDDGRVKFRVNVPALARSGLRVANDKLLELGELVFVDPSVRASR
jgi:hypothetical protein